MQRARANKGNSVLLHELYFDGMALASHAVPAELSAAINKRFGSFDKWAADFKACAKTAAGWAMLTRHSVNGKLYNLVSDKHADGPLWMATPLLVIDMYEHAYYIDYKNNKSAYIEKFLQHIDWHEINRRFVAES